MRGKEEVGSCLFHKRSTLMLVTDDVKKPLSTALYYGLRSLPIKALFARQLAQPMRGNKALQPEKFRPDTEVFVRHSAASPITTIHSLSPKARSDAHIIYLHGGGYAMQALFFHRRFAEKLAIRTSSIRSACWISPCRPRPNVSKPCAR